MGEAKVMRGKEKYRLVITVKEIRGNCPVFKVGDKIVVESPKIVVSETDNICIHALGCMLSIIVPLSCGISFKKLGLAKEEDEKATFNAWMRESLTRMAEQCFSK